MAMTAAGMLSDIQTAIAAASITTGVTDPVAAATEADKAMLAWCQGIINHITGNAIVTTTTGAPNSEHTGNIT